ncbi:MAG: DUF2975 domain-containing protein [Alphaproteobacteria bacterium]|nr:DUF2975 domain-containing protein [Alphaproteobacteria bacterium]MDE2112490.1 DUF2975 domain-containing protein [Alphaproteobacteria bacterium]MDE2494214.1 DUF2975 domain-containing protein [Alphaproteobacteria bacterium]
MTKINWLPKFLRWMFTIFAGFMIVATIAVCAVIVINPALPAGTQIGPFEVDMLGQPGSVVLRADHGASTFAVSALRGNMTMSVDQASGLIEVLKHYGLPLILLSTIYFAMLFDLLRRLFRNVGRGDSFTQQSLHLVQTIGVSLLVFSLVSAVAESWFSREMLTYLAQHTVVSISGTAIHFPVPQGTVISGGHGFPFGSPYFFSGLLVLALSEVFRQGLALKSENDLTV